MRPHARALIGVLLLLCIGLTGCDKCGNPIKINMPSAPSSCYGPTPAR